MSSAADAPTEADEISPFPEPIKLRWDGNARDRFRERLEALDTDRAELTLATLDRLKTRVVCEDTAEAEAFAAELSTFLDGLQNGVYDWVDSRHISAVQRVHTTLAGALRGHYDDHPPVEDVPSLKPAREAADTEVAWRARCPDCGWSRTYTDRVEATIRQYRVGCANCDRGVGVSKVEVATDGGAVTESESSPETCPDCGSFLPEAEEDEAVACGNCGTVSNGETVTVYRQECDRDGCPTGNGLLREGESFARMDQRIHAERHDDCEPVVRAYVAIPKRGTRSYEVLEPTEVDDE